MVWQHVYPLDDLKPHDTESKNCDCNPRIDWDAEIIVHNSWDCREAVEWAEDILGGSEAKGGGEK